MKLKIIYTLAVFIVETIIQALYSTLKIKYFVPFHNLDNFADIFGDTIYVIGSIKAVFFLPIYLIYHLTITNRSKIKLFLNHTLLFTVLYSLLILFMPNSFNGIIDILIYIGISFVSSLFVYFILPVFKKIILPTSMQI